MGWEERGQGQVLFAPVAKCRRRGDRAHERRKQTGTPSVCRGVDGVHGVRVPEPRADDRSHNFGPVRFAETLAELAKIYCSS